MAQSATQIRESLVADETAAIQAEADAKKAAVSEHVDSQVEGALRNQLSTAEQRLNDRRTAVVNDEAEVAAAQAELDAFLATPAEPAAVEGEVQG